MIMPTKFLKPKNMRRGLLALLLVAPLVYMFGSLFTALNGAHGAQVFAQPVYVDEWIEVDTYVNDGSTYKFIVNDTNIRTALQYDDGDIVNYRLQGTYTLNDYPKGQYGGNSEYSMLIQHYNAESYYRIYTYGGTPSGMTPMPSPIFNGNGIFSLNLPWVFTNMSDVFISSFISYFGSYGQLYKLQLVPSTTIVDNPASYSDYVFSQFFAKDNWVASLGEKAVNNDIGIGLPFVGDLISYIDENAMPLSDSPYGYFIWGYSSYILNVLAIYMVVSISASLVLIPMKVVDSLEERING